MASKIATASDCNTLLNNMSLANKWTTDLNKCLTATEISTGSGRALRIHNDATYGMWPKKIYGHRQLVPINAIGRDLSLTQRTSAYTYGFTMEFINGGGYVYEIYYIKPSSSSSLMSIIVPTNFLKTIKSTFYKIHIYYGEPRSRIGGSPTTTGSYTINSAKFGYNSANCTTLTIDSTKKYAYAYISTAGMQAVINSIAANVGLYVYLA